MNETSEIIGRYKTVNQLAIEYGMTKNGMLVRINKMRDELKANGVDESEYLTQGKKNTIYVREKGLEWLATWNAKNTPMQAPTPDIEKELLKLEQAEQRTHDLEEQQEELKNTISFLRDEITNKTNQINMLSATVAKQAQTIDTQSNQILQLTAPKEDQEIEEPEKATEEETGKGDTVYNEREGTKSAFSISDEQLTTELSKRGFWDKLKLLFS